MLAPTPRTGKHMHASMRALGSTSSNFVRDLDHPSTHAPPICAAPVSTETSTTSPQASHAPNHGCPRLPAPAKPARYLPATTRALGSTSNNFARDLDHPRTHAPPVCVGPVRAVRANTCTLLASNDARSDPLQATCARPWPPAHPRATIMRWASDNGEQPDQSASLPRSPPCLPRLPALANTSALLASKDARVRIHFQQLCAQPGPPAHPRATIMPWASDNGEQHDQCASVARIPSPIMLARLPAPCARLGPPAHLRGTIMRCASENREQHDQSTSLPRTQ